MAPMTAHFLPTARVIATGLKGRDDLNAQEMQVLLPLAGERYAVRVTLTGEEVRIRPINLLAAPQILDTLGPDGLFSCLLRMPPPVILAARLLSRLCRDQAVTALRTGAWQARHLPVAALCCARAWAGALERLSSHPAEGNQSTGEWMDVVIGTPLDEEEEVEQDGEEDEGGEEEEEVEGEEDEEGAARRRERQKERERQAQEREEKMQELYCLLREPGDADFESPPLDLAVRYGAPAELVRALLRLHPGCAAEEECSTLPLHRAVCAGAPPAVLAALLEAHPAGAAAEERDAYQEAK